MEMRSPSPMDIDPENSAQGNAQDSAQDSKQAPQAFKRFRDVGGPAHQSTSASGTFKPRVSAETSTLQGTIHRRRGPQELQALRDILANAKFLTPQYIAKHYPTLAEILARPVEPPKPALKRLQHGPVKAYEAPEKTPAVTALTTSFSELLGRSTYGKPETMTEPPRLIAGSTDPKPKTPPQLTAGSTDPKPKTPPQLSADQRHDSRVATSSSLSAQDNNNNLASTSADSRVGTSSPLSAQRTDNNTLATTPAVAASSPPSSIESPLPERQSLPPLPGVNLALGFPETLPPELQDREELVTFQFKYVVEMWNKTSQRHRTIFSRYNELPDEIKNRLGEKVMSDNDELNMYADDMRTIDHYLVRLSQHEHIPLVIYEGFKALKLLWEGFGLQETALDHLEDELDEDEAAALKKYGETTPLQDQDAAVE